MNQVEWDELIIEIEQHILKLDQASRSVGELFYDSLQARTIEIFTQYITGFYDIAQAIATTVENSEEFAPSMKEELSPYVNELFDQFEQMRLLLTQERLVSLADILKYEIPNCLQHILTAMKE